MIENKCLPLVYILTGDKKGDTYSYVLSVIKYFFDQNCPTDTGTVLIDFEKAVMNSFRDILPGWKVANCYFHLCQSVQKNISKKFKVRYFKDKRQRLSTCSLLRNTLVIILSNLLYSDV